MLLASLLMGGVLKGQELITIGRSKQLIGDLNGLQAALHVYRHRYGTLPGDDGNAATRWASAGAKAGDNDGLIGGKYQNQVAPGSDPSTQANLAESISFWWHLRLAGFVLGPAVGNGAADLPTNSSGGIVGVQQAEAGFIPTLMACASNVSARSAIAVDSEFDDRLPAAGRVRARRQTGGISSPALADADVVQNYVEDGTSRYVVCRALD